MTRKCKTDGTHYSINVDNGTQSIGILISLPYRMSLTTAQAKLLRKRMHDALESALAETFKFGGWSERFYAQGARSEPYMINRR
jgi:hypothetical protein